jgi:MFS family permease
VDGIGPGWLKRWLRSYQMMGPAARRRSGAVFLWGVGEGLWMYIRPLYVAELGGDPVQIGQVLAISGLAPVLFMLPAGRLSDLFGPRKLMIACWWVGTLATALLAVVPDWTWLGLGFFLYSVSASAIPAMNAYVALDVTQREGPERAGQTMQMLLSRVMAAYLAGTIISPLIGGWLGESLGLRLVFLISAGWFLVSTLAVYSLPPVTHTRRPAAAPPDPDAKPVAWWRFSPAQIQVFGVLLAMFIVISTGYTLVPNFLEDVRGLSVGVIGGLGGATAAGGVIWLLVLGRYHSRTALLIASGLIGAAWVGLLVGVAGAFQIPLLLGVYFLLGIYTAARSLSLAAVGDVTPPDQHGTSFGLLETLFGVGAFAGPWLAGQLYSQAPQLPFVMALVGLVPLAPLLWLTLSRTRRVYLDKTQEQPLAAPVEVPLNAGRF